MILVLLSVVGGTYLSPWFVERRLRDLRAKVSVSISSPVFSAIPRGQRLGNATLSVFRKQALGEGKRIWRFWYDRLNNARYLGNMLSDVSL
jgi:hypothetical protein